MWQSKAKSLVKTKSIPFIEIKYIATKYMKETQTCKMKFKATELQQVSLSHHKKQTDEVEEKKEIRIWKTENYS